jgi:hypothetical protein
MRAGIFTWKINHGGHVIKGREAGCCYADKRTGGKTYITINLYKKKYPAHRLVFLYMIGRFPNAILDHINGDGTDNRWNNLREASIAENNRNARLQHNNKSGITGVSWHKQHKKWYAKINHNGKSIFLGLFENINDAKKVRKNAEIAYGFHQNHGQKRPL